MVHKVTTPVFKANERSSQHCESLQEVRMRGTQYKDRPKLLAFVVAACARCEPVIARQAVARPIQSNAPSVLDYEALATERYIA